MKKEINANGGSSRYQKARDIIDPAKEYPLHEAIELLKKASYAKFDATVEAHIVLNLPESKGEKALRFRTTLPHGVGKTSRILVFSDQTVAGATIGGNDEIVEKIVKGELKPNKDFEIVIATPGWMPKIAKLARILGPQGMMPSPKAGTVAEDLQSVITELGKGSQVIKTESTAPVIHAVLGKISFTSSQLEENMNALLSTLQAHKPTKVKGEYIKKAVLATTMSPGVRLVLDRDL